MGKINRDTIKRNSKIAEYARILADEFALSNPVKLQKLLFFTRYEEIKNSKSLEGSELFNENNNFQAWINGPVHVGIYNYFWPFYHDCLIEEAEEFHPKEASRGEFEKYIKSIEKYLYMEVEDLVELSHKTKAWIEARGDLDEDDPSQNLIDEKNILDEEMDI